MPMHRHNITLKYACIVDHNTECDVASFPGRRRNGLATSASSNCIRMLRHGNCNISLQQTSARDTTIFPPVRTLMCDSYFRLRHQIANWVCAPGPLQRIVSINLVSPFTLSQVVISWINVAALLCLDASRSVRSVDMKL